jgi:WD40 repeat protein/serine/threonine protein kinase
VRPYGAEDDPYLSLYNRKSTQEWVMTNRQLDEETIFHIARKMPDLEARAAYLNQICAGDLNLRRRVEALLEVHEQEGEFLKSADEPAPTQDSPVTEGPGTVVGRYKLLQKIGEGGFGIVFMAEQQTPVVRKVALKVIKPGMDSHAVVARFEAERQALALMDHPNIAHILDGGVTESGRPYFVMDLVKGVSITEYCDRNELSTEDRLRLFMDVCRAVQHAHQKGIIHRDLKPSNILVTLHDGKPVPRVIDFGVSKALHQRLTEKTLFTAFGQMIGTPQYMSPEQAEMSGLDVDTRSDVYSLGVLLYELLTGTTPLEAGSLRDAGYAEIQRMIKETEPPRPSVRLSTEGEKLTAIAKHRSIDPNDLQKLISGDLDWIVMKALEKERVRRYENTSDFAADVERFLSGDAVEAHPPSPGYRLRKLARRNRSLVATLATILLAVVLGLVGATTGMISAIRSADQAEAERLVAEQERRIAVGARSDAEKALERAEDAEHQALEETKRRRRQQYVSDMNAAMAAWQDGNFTRVADLLKRHSPTLDDDDLRRFEWYYLWRAYHQNRKHRDIAVAEMPTSISLFGDDKSGRLAVGDAWGTVTLRQLNGNTEIDRQLLCQGLAGTWFQTALVLFSPDGRSLAYTDRDTKNLVLRTLGGGVAPTRFDYSGIIRGIAFSGDGRLLAATAIDELGLQGVAIIWDVESGELAKTFSVGAIGKDWFDFFKIAFSRDGRLLAIGTAGGQVEVWDWNKDNEPPIVLTPTRTNRGPKKVYSVAFSPGDSLLAAGLHDGTVRIWDWDEIESTSESNCATQREKAILLGHSEPVYCVAYAPDESTLASGSSDGTVKLWDVTDLDEIRTLSAHSDAVVGLQFSGDGRTLVSAGLDYSIRFWPIRQDTEENGHDEDQQGQSVFIGPRTVARVADGKLKCWTLDDVEQSFEMPDIGKDVQCIAMSRDGLLAVKTDSDVELWHLATGRLCGVLPVSRDFALAKNTPMVFSRNGRVLAVASQSGRSFVWNTDDGQLQSDFDVHAEVSSLALSPDGHLLAIAANEKAVTLWNTQTGILEDRLEGPRDTLHCVTFSSDGQQVAAGGYDNTVWIWHWQARGSQPRALKAHSASIVSVLFSETESTIFSIDSGGVLRAWDTDTMQMRCKLTANRGDRHLALSPDGCVLTTGGKGTFRVFHAASNNEVRAFGWHKR